MALVRDPSFWRRFSLAVHHSEKVSQDESLPPNTISSEKKSFEPTGLKHNDSWLEAQTRKKNRHALLCWIFWLCFFTLTAGVVVILLWLKAKGLLGNKTSTTTTSTSSPPGPGPNST